MKRITAFTAGCCAWLLLAGRIGAEDIGIPSNPSSGIAFEQKLENQLPLEALFVDEHGATRPLGHYFSNRPVIVALVYYGCPQLCTEVLNGLTRTLRVLTLDAGHAFDVLVVSIDPTENPALALRKKEAYLRQYGRAGVTNGWHCLTGNTSSIQQLADAIGFGYRYDPGLRQYIHPAGITLVTPKGKVARYFFGIDYSPRDLRLGLVEAASEKIGSPIDQLLLLCYRYDPATGRYGPIIFGTLRAAGLGTVLFLGSGIWLMLRRERRRNKGSPAANHRKATS